MDDECNGDVTPTIGSTHRLSFGTISRWNGIGAARSSKNTLRLTGKGVSMPCWFGEVEGLFPAIWSLGNPTRNRSRKAERKSSSVRGAVVISETATLPTATFEDSAIGENAILRQLCSKSGFHEIHPQV